MTTKARRERRGTAKRWFSSSQAARYLGVSVDTIRDLDESGELQAERTKGGHRRFSREKLDAYLGKTKRGRSVRPEAGARRPPPRASRAQRIPEPPDDNPEDLELMDAEVEGAVEVPLPVPQLNPVERLVRDMTDQLKRDRAEAPRRRLVALKQYGLNQVPWGVPDSWRPKVATALEGYVTLENFPSWVSDQQAYAFVRGKVEEVLQPYRDEVARGQQETQDQRRVQALIDYGKRYASDKAPFDWESHERMHLTLKTEATKPAESNVLQQQARFDAFVERYNQERPHQALGMQVPAAVYTRSPRVYRGLEELTYPYHDATITVTHCGRLCFQGRQVNLSQVFAGQNVGVTQVGERLWLVTFMQYDLGYFDDETCRLEPIENPFGPKVLPMCSE